MRLGFLLPIALSASLVTTQVAVAQQPASGSTAATAATVGTTEGGFFGADGLFGPGGFLGGAFAGGGLFGLGTGVTFGIFALTGILIGFTISENVGGGDQPNSP